MDYLPVIKKGEYCSECRRTSNRVLSECKKYYLCVGSRTQIGCGHRYYVVTAKPKENPNAKPT